MLGKRKLTDETLQDACCKRLKQTETDSKACCAFAHVTGADRAVVFAWDSEHEFRLFCRAAIGHPVFLNHHPHHGTIADMRVDYLNTSVQVTVAAEDGHTDVFIMGVLWLHKPYRVIVPRPWNPSAHGGSRRHRICLNSKFMEEVREKLFTQQAQLPLTWAIGAASQKKQETPLNRFYRHDLSAFSQISREIFNFCDGPLSYLR